MKNSEIKERYTSLEEMRRAWHLKPVTKQTKDQDKLMKQRENFKGKHLCPTCKAPMEFVNGTNVMCCRNPECEANKKIDLDIKKNDVINDINNYCILDKKGTEIASNIFA